MKWSPHKKSKDTSDDEVKSARLKIDEERLRFYNEALRKLLGTVKATLIQEPAEISE